jgi:hypothetical protein
MSNARQEVAQYGWEIYRDSAPRPSLDQINERLTEEGLESVSPRTYLHYRKLERNGIQEYLPINELDVRVKALRAAS